jgi:hypothetical protein
VKEVGVLIVTQLGAVRDEETVAVVVIVVAATELKESEG